MGEYRARYPFDAKIHTIFEGTSENQQLVVARPTLSATCLLP
jgi:alkylation response protein AidB-like acyl-CoA dehydrogenase